MKDDVIALLFRTANLTMKTSTFTTDSSGLFQKSMSYNKSVLNSVDLQNGLSRKSSRDLLTVVKCYIFTVQEIVFTRLGDQNDTT